MEIDDFSSMSKDGIKTSDLINILSSNRIAIYGTGFVGLHFYDILVRRGLESNIDCFIVSNINNIPREVKGIQVKSVYDIYDKKKYIICIAVHEVIRCEIEQILDENGMTKYIWIYPYLWELALGEPKKCNIKMPVDKIIRQCRDYRVVVRYLAIENNFGKNNYGYEIYIKSQGMHCERVTAEKRLNRFCKLIRDWKMTGYKPEHRVLIFENGELIDGFHRIALAKYCHMKEIMCDIFKKPLHWEEWRQGDEKEKHYLSKDVDIMTSADFSLEEISIIDDTFRRICEEV